MIISKKGFTLIEILVAVAVFMILMGGLFGIVTYSLRINNNSIASEQLLDQAGSAMEYMSRMARMAKRGDGICLPLNSNYLSNAGADLTFLISENGISKCVVFSKADNAINVSIAGVSDKLTSDDITITNLKFLISGDSANNQPKVTILIDAQSNYGNPKPFIRMQTTVSQRDLNIAP